MKSLTLLLILGALVFILGAAPLSGLTLDTNTGQAFQTDPTLVLPTLPISTQPAATPAPSNPGIGNNTLLIIGVVILGLILFVLLIWAISRSSHSHD